MPSSPVPTGTDCSICSSERGPARRNLPVGMPVDAELVELRVPVPDRPGVLAEVTTAAAELGVNIVDFEVAHSARRRGVCSCSLSRWMARRLSRPRSPSAATTIRGR